MSGLPGCDLPVRPAAWAVPVSRSVVLGCWLLCLAAGAAGAAAPASVRVSFFGLLRPVSLAVSAPQGAHAWLRAKSGSARRELGPEPLRLRAAPGGVELDGAGGVWDTVTVGPAELRLEAAGAVPRRLRGLAIVTCLAGRLRVFVEMESTELAIAVALTEKEPGAGIEAVRAATIVAHSFVF